MVLFSSSKSGPSVSGANAGSNWVRSLTNTSGFFLGSHSSPVSTEDTDQMSPLSPSRSLSGREWAWGEAGGSTVWEEGQLLAESGHYPVALAANCSFPVSWEKSQLTSKLQGELLSKHCQLLSPSALPQSSLSPSGAQT